MIVATFNMFLDEYAQNVLSITDRRHLFEIERKYPEDEAVLEEPKTLDGFDKDLAYLIEHNTQCNIERGDWDNDRTTECCCVIMVTKPDVWDIERFEKAMAMLFDFLDDHKARKHTVIGRYAYDENDAGGIIAYHHCCEKETNVWNNHPNNPMILLHDRRTTYERIFNKKPRNQ